MVVITDINHRVKLLKLKAACKYNISPEKCHIGHILLQGLLDFPADCNQIDATTNATETNRSMATRSSRLASAMKNYGMQPGDAVILMAPNHLDLAVPFYACHYNGYPVCGIDCNVTAVDLKSLFSYLHPKMVFCQKGNENNVKDALYANNWDGPVVIFDDENANLECFILKYKGTEINFRPNEFDHSETMAWYLLTSGTTGVPKVAMIPFDTLLNGVCCWWTPFTDKFEITLTMATLQWISSLMFFVSGPLKGFTRLQTSAPLTPQSLVVAINKYKPNVTAWSPFLLSQFLSAAENICDLSSFRYIAIGGSAIEKPLFDRFRKKCGAFLYLVYGMTELLVPVFDFDDNTPFGSTGTPSDKYTFRIIGDDGHVLDKPFKTGELWIKGDAFFKGYLHNPEETRTILTEDGWFKTGDMFYRDDQDYYYFVERKRLIIKHQRFMIAPLQLEEVIKRHPGVLDVCVVGIPDPECLELPVAAILKRNGCNVDPQEIFDLLKKDLPHLEKLRGSVFFVDSLPVTPSGKVHRAKVKEMALTAPRNMSK